jgi:electron transport complex protein RnfG
MTVNQHEMKRTAPPKTWNMFRAMGGVGILCSLLIVFTYQVTLPTILRKKAEFLEKAIYKALPEAKTKNTFGVVDNKFELLRDEEREGRKVYAGYDDQGRLVGIAIEARGQGFQDAISIIYGYSPENQTVVGMQVLESKETPGLGDKIEKDPAFLKNFEALDVSLAEDGKSVQNPIEVVKQGTKEFPWQIDGITGATISSKAIGKILEESTAEMVPLLARELDVFKDE